MVEREPPPSKQIQCVATMSDVWCATSDAARTSILHQSLDVPNERNRQRRQVPELHSSIGVSDSAKKKTTGVAGRSGGTVTLKINGHGLVEK
jgi:hypothetical protein